MTTLKDLLNDFAGDMLNLKADDSQEFEEEKEMLLDEYIDAICKRWVGQE